MALDDQNAGHAEERAEIIFSSYLEGYYQGEPDDLEALCRQHPDLADTLRQRHRAWRQVSRLIQNAAARMPCEDSHAGKVTGGGKDRREPRERSPDDSAPIESVAPPGEQTGELIRRLAGSPTSPERYLVQGEVARGGMGRILRIWDPLLNRNAAMKVILQKSLPRSTPSHPDLTLISKHARESRFLEEAQVTGQLDHPGIIPVHELGLDAEGRLYFTMRLVRGRNLKGIFDLVHSGREEWSQTRALGIMLKICEAMAYAHSKGVVHRDLKPANVMVGRFGEVYVMDWGLARVAGQEDRHDVRLRDLGTSSVSAVHTERGEERARADAPPIMTRDGDILGTPSYMPPEQARGLLEQINSRSDVYAVGAMLYHLLSGQMPYVPADGNVAGHTVLRWVIDGPPEPLRDLAPRVPPELAAICEKAMAREPAQRYADMSEMADDLRAFMENRVVRAYRQGALVELRKWVIRNKISAASLAAALLIAITGLAGLMLQQRQARRAAERRERDILELSDLTRLEAFVTDAEQLWPEIPENEDRFTVWLNRVQPLAARLPVHVAALARLREQALRSPSAPAGNTDGSSAAQHPWLFATTELQWRHDTLVDLVDGLERLVDPDPRVGLIASMKERIDHAREVQDDLEFYQEDWQDTIETIADRTQSPVYGGLAIHEQVGLVPIGEDPDSNLWEFAFPRSGAIPELDSDGELQVTGETGLVFVLLPGGTFQMGSPAISLASRNIASRARTDEQPAGPVTLAPFFISKYEMTQGQWLRLTGENPSYYTSKRHPTWKLDLPVENVSYLNCERTLDHAGLALPTEAQWEYAARAGTQTPWWTGDKPDSIAGAGNFADRAFHEKYEDQPFLNWLTDRFPLTAPIGRFSPNPFGLYDTMGNVREWCRDGYDPGSYKTPPRQGDGFRSLDSTEGKVFRGGGFGSLERACRSAHRMSIAQESRGSALGCRPVRALK